MYKVVISTIFIIFSTESSFGGDVPKCNDETILFSLRSPFKNFKSSVILHLTDMPKEVKNIQNKLSDEKDKLARLQARMKIEQPSRPIDYPDIWTTLGNEVHDEQGLILHLETDLRNAQEQYRGQSKALESIKTLTASVVNIRQAEYDEDNHIRYCSAQLEIDGDVEYWKPLPKELCFNIEYKIEETLDDPPRSFVTRNCGPDERQ